MTHFEQIIWMPGTLPLSVSFHTHDQPLVVLFDQSENIRCFEMSPVFCFNENLAFLVTNRYLWAAHLNLFRQPTVHQSGSVSAI